MEKAQVILIAGPTASGKSALALALAGHLGGTVINADSMQVYRNLRILTARPAPEDEARLPHRLYGVVGGEEAYSAARFARDAAGAIAEARLAHRLPIIVGGTGLYFKALLEGLSPIPPVPDGIRRHWRGEAGRLGTAELHAVLAGRDPFMAERLRPTDPQRIVRALEVLDATGRSLAEWRQNPGEPVIAAEDALRLVVEIERDELHRRCDARLERMMADGALEEVERLVALGLHSELPVMRALGVRPLRDFLAGRLSRADALARAKAETRQYAKRQKTWMRRNMSTWTHINTQQMERKLAEIVRFINS